MRGTREKSTISSNCGIPRASFITADFFPLAIKAVPRCGPFVQVSAVVYRRSLKITSDVRALGSSTEAAKHWRRSDAGCSGPVSIHAKEAKSIPGLKCDRRNSKGFYVTSEIHAKSQKWKYCDINISLWKKKSQNEQQVCFNVKRESLLYKKEIYRFMKYDFVL